MHDGHLPSDLAHEVHVVLDEKNGVVLGDALNEIGSAPLALLGHAGGRLVEQQKLRLARR